VESRAPCGRSDSLESNIVVDPYDPVVLAAGSWKAEKMGVAVCEPWMVIGILAQCLGRPLRNTRRHWAYRAM